MEVFWQHENVYTFLSGFWVVHCQGTVHHFLILMTLFYAEEDQRRYFWFIQWKWMESGTTLDPTDFRCMKERKNWSIFLCSTEERKSWVNDDKILHFWVNAPKKHPGATVHVHTHRRSGVKGAFYQYVIVVISSVPHLMHINLFSHPRIHDNRSDELCTSSFSLCWNASPKNLSTATKSSYCRREKWKITAFGSLRMFYFVCNFPPPPSFVSPPSQHKSRRSHSPGSTAATE